jgi:hypothetical protein
VQRLVTEVRLRRKRIQKEDKIKRWKRTIALTEEYKKVYDAWANKKRAVANDIKQQRKNSKTEAPVETKKPVEVKKAVAAKKEEPKKTAKTVEAPKTKAPAATTVTKVAEKVKAKK